MSVKKLEIISLFVACLLGMLFHFVYGWSGENPVAGIFFPVNESTWEHLKLIFFPILLVSVPEYFLLPSALRDRFWFSKLVSVLAGMILTVVLFYTYTGVYGKNVDALNILIYFIAMIAAYLLGYRILNTGKKQGLSTTASLLFLFIFFLLFAVFTKRPPDIGLFEDPAKAGTYETSGSKKKRSGQRISDQGDILCDSFRTLWKNRKKA